MGQRGLVEEKKYGLHHLPCEAGMKIPPSVSHKRAKSLMLYTSPSLTKALHLGLASGGLVCLTPVCKAQQMRCYFRLSTFPMDHILGLPYLWNPPRSGPPITWVGWSHSIANSKSV